MLGLDAPSHWAILIIAALILFGYKKLPEMSRSVGRSLRIFKTEMKGMTEDDTARDAAEGSKSEPTAPVSQQIPPVVVPPSLGADTSPAVPGGQTQPAAEASRETPQQQA
jgi:sec-independent protein translocase protein TatA